MVYATLATTKDKVLETIPITALLDVAKVAQEAVELYGDDTLSNALTTLNNELQKRGFEPI